MVNKQDVMVYQYDLALAILHGVYVYVDLGTMMETQIMVM